MEKKNSLTLGFYHHYLRHWFETNSDPSQYLILQAEAMYRQPYEVMQQFATFMALPPFTIDEMSQFAIIGTNKVKNSLRVLKKFKYKICDRATLESYYEPHNKKLRELLDHFIVNEFPIPRNETRPNWMHW